MTLKEFFRPTKGKISTPLGILIIVLIVLAVGVGGWWFLRYHYVCSDGNPNACEKTCSYDSDCRFTCCGCVSKKETKCLTTVQCKKLSDSVCKCIDNTCTFVGIKQVTITTDKTEYEQGETVNMTIQNKEEKAIDICGSSACSMIGSFPTQIEKYEDDIWVQKFITCPIVTLRLDMVFEKGIYSCLSILPNSSLKLELRTDSEKGLFRTVYYIEKQVAIYSNEFTIK